MQNQKGQSAVEFALIVPLFFTMCFGTIYGGILFMDYLQFNNAARGVARAISIADGNTERDKLKADFENNTGSYFNQMTKLYTPTATVQFEQDTSEPRVKVTIKLDLDYEDLPGVLTKINFPPKKLNDIEVVMPLEVQKNQT